ncbi:MAG: M15 family metallopeptidase [Lachnospiraceae bacterium]|nr:M15 family metallopeptidase [Lachnospiraceae bacterium]
MATDPVARKIPHVEDPARFELRDFQESEFVEIVASEKIDIKMQYPILGMACAEPQCFLRREAAERLYQAAEGLPAGYRFRIWDAWRPFALQKELYEVYSKDIIRDFHLESVSEEERAAVIRGFVSDPIADREVPPAHTTGGAIDLTILDENGAELDMGTKFDAFTSRTITDFFENDDIISNQDPQWNEAHVKEIRENRRLLYFLMTDAGFTNLPSEWWHFDFGDRNWAYYRNQPAIYKGAFTKEELHGK